MDDKAIVTIENVSKDFSLPHERRSTIKQVFVSPFQTSMHKNTTKQHALKNISFEVKQGEFFGIVGRNGSGKSTLLKMIAGIYQPTKGKVKVAGKLVPFIELGVGFNPELTGKQNVYLNGALLGFSKKEVAAMYDDIVNFAELGRFMDQKLKNYSSGMQVRLAFSMAVQAKADVLLIDEVLAVGDADFQRKCFNYFKQLKQQKTTVIFVSHDMQAVREYCDRAVLIEKGRIKDSGDVKRVSEEYSQLFMDNSTVANDTSERWGEGGVTYEKPTVKVTAKSITIDAAIAVKKDVQDLVLGFTVISSDGVEVMGTNSRIKQRVLPAAAAGDHYDIHWSFDNILEDGTYSLALTAHGVSGQPVFDWWSNALSITVSKMERTGYKVSPDIELKLNKRTP